MRRAAIALIIVVSYGCPARSAIEIGASMALSSLLNYDSTSHGYHWDNGKGWFVHAAGQSPLFHVLWLPASRISLGPEFSIAQIASIRPNKSFTGYQIGGRFSLFYLRPNTQSGPYIMGHAGLLRTRYWETIDFDFALGPGLGWRWVKGKTGSLGIEGRFSRWIDNRIYNWSLWIRMGML